MKNNAEKLWKQAASFHGHVCMGLVIGYKAALYAIELLDLDFSKNEQIVCISENDACGVDAIQAILGCSVGKGNLLFHMRGKQAFSFYNRSNGRSVRLILDPIEEDERSMKERVDHYMKISPKKLFTAMPVKIELPEKARIFKSYDCECCGERTASNWIRLAGGKKLCMDCWNNYDRFNV